ncbi:DUF7112 family protein [Halobacterium litoreum]|uniref:Uncharacterized protein n=1 Tax=Halobacterium litoreum TaxID=2039234 RepID=A0ABD5NI35_9EURY|nr:hypothetical protein [Halobacterium litoreum]UHH12229.1 hypothetical protein LT972_08675 [Halobacterium litoreum]
MTDRVTDDALDTVVGTLARAGGTRRLELRLPADAAESFPVDEVVRVVLDGTERRARLSSTGDDRPVVRGVYDTPRLARNPGDGENRLLAWVDDRDLEAGRSVHVDVVEPEFKYGIRAPGESATYDATGTPDSGLADIARSVEEN